MFFDPANRLYWPLLLSSGLFVALYYGKLPKTKTIKHYFKSKSTWTDIGLLVTNQLLKATVFASLFASAATISYYLKVFFIRIYPGDPTWNLSALQAKIFLTLFVFLFDDFLRFTQHMLMHKYAWRLHSLHHSATLLTPLTLFRTHPLESFIGFARNTILHGITLFLMTTFIKNQVTLMDFLGVNLFGFIFNAALANLRHSPVPVSFGIFEYIIVSPRMHQIHHSNLPNHFNKNYGVVFTIWDHIAGSFYRPSGKEMENITYGT